MIYGTIGQFVVTPHTDIFNPLWFLPASFCALLIGYVFLHVIDKDPFLGALALIATLCVSYALGLHSI